MAEDTVKKGDKYSSKGVNYKKVWGGGGGGGGWVTLHVLCDFVQGGSDGPGENRVAPGENEERSTFN